MASIQLQEEIFNAALECAPEQLAAFLDSRCTGDSVLRTNLEAMLASHQNGDTSIEDSIAAVAANLVQNRGGDSMTGQTIGHYRVLKQIGAGGMGEVYLASDINGGRSAALK